MLKLQVALIAILIACVAFVSCNRMQKMLAPVADAPMAADDMMADDMMTMMMEMMDSTMYMSWEHVMLPAPAMTVAEAAAAMNAAGTGAAHGEGTRTAYINDIGVMANQAGTAYPAGTTIVKTIMDDANTFVAKKAVMMKTEDPMYADHGGWMYVKYARASETDEYMLVGGGSVENSMGCHGCHAKAENDSVFVSLPMDEDMMDEDMMDEDMMDEDMMDEDMMDEDMMDEDMMDEDMDEDMMDEDMMDEDMMDEDMMDEDMGDDGMDDGADAANGAGDAGNGAGDAQ